MTSPGVTLRNGSVRTLARAPLCRWGKRRATSVLRTQAFTVSRPRSPRPDVWLGSSAALKTPRRAGPESEREQVEFSFER
jgi:hypothetical protein